MNEHKESTSSTLLGRCKVKVVMTAPEMKDSLSDNVRGEKLESGDLPDGWERWSLPRNGNYSRGDTVIIGPWGRKFDRIGKLEKYLKGSQRCLNLSFKNISISYKSSNSTHSCGVPSRKVASNPELGIQSTRKIKKKPKSRRCDKKMTTLSEFPGGSIGNAIIFHNPQTVQERRRNLSILKDYNQKHEDDFFDSVGKSSTTSKFLLNSSSSSGGSSPNLSRRSSPGSFLQTRTREDTPLQLREILHKDEEIVSADSFGRISFINRKLRKPRVAKNLLKSKSCSGLVLSEVDRPSCEELLKSALKVLSTPDTNFDHDLSDVESYFTDDESNGN